MVATPGLDDDHVAVLVRFCVVLSLKDPVAVNRCVPPVSIEGALGLREIEARVADEPPPPDEGEEDLPLQATNAANEAITISSGRLRFTSLHHNGEAHGHIQT
jgi:hypothetical protein